MAEDIRTYETTTYRDSPVRDIPVRDVPVNDVPVAPGRPTLEFVKRISWPAVFGGVMVALATEIMFLFFGLFIGFTMTGYGAIFNWTTAWYLVTSFCALFAGGWVAARLSPEGSSGSLHGLVTWGLATLTTFIFTLNLGWAVTNGAMRVVQIAQAAPVATAPVRTAAVTNAPYVATFTYDQLWVYAIILFGGVVLACFAGWLGGKFGNNRLVSPRAI